MVECNVSLAAALAHAATAIPTIARASTPSPTHTSTVVGTPTTADTARMPIACFASLEPTSLAAPAIATCTLCAPTTHTAKFSTTGTTGATPGTASATTYFSALIASARCDC